jgi:hypothetical protein
MNLKEGVRRLALFIGGLGIIIGGFGSYVILRSALSQRENHIKFEQLATSDMVQKSRKNIEVSEAGPSKNHAPAKFDWSVVITCPLDTADFSGCYTEVKKGGIKTIHWSKALGVESIAMEDDQTIYPTPLPSRWLYLLAAILPVIGFIVPWSSIRAVGWVGSGFSAK